jgi:hypothetical protein
MTEDPAPRSLERDLAVGWAPARRRATTKAPDAMGAEVEDGDPSMMVGEGDPAAVVQPCRLAGITAGLQLRDPSANVRASDADEPRRGPVLRRPSLRSRT